MKKFIPLLFLLFFQLPFKSINAQEWAPIGSIWYYSMNEGPYSSVISYITMTPSKDTIINNSTYRELQIIHHKSDSSLVIWEPQYIKYDSLRLWYIKDGNPQVLYDFSLSIDDLLYIRGDSGYCDSIYTYATIQQKGYQTINSTSLRYFNLTYTYVDSWYLGSRVIEKIGSLFYFFPVQNCVMTKNSIYDYPGDLRCYYDPIFGLYKQPFYSRCDTILSNIDNNVFSNDLSINFIDNNRIQILNPTNKEIRGIFIFDILGNNKEKIYYNLSNEIFINNLSNGFYYCIEVITKQNIIIKKIIKL